MGNLIKLAAKELIEEDELTTGKRELTQTIKKLEQERADTKKRASSWYDTAERVFELAVHGRETFASGTKQEKQDILASVGVKVLIKDKRLEITPHPAIVPIQNGYKELEEQYHKVRTAPERSKKHLTEEVRSTWLGLIDVKITFSKDTSITEAELYKLQAVLTEDEKEESC